MEEKEVLSGALAKAELVRVTPRAALADLVAAAEEFSDANRAWFESKRPSPRLGIPIPGKRETEKVQTAWEEMDKSVERARKVMKEEK